ncbi:hypothetical protein [Pseudoxanthomonas sp. 10H]|uniref:hypothetical protein n=1 Tax=Pseudoxanthomonas sp. 10H TaxID=3242729 RepID=UPI003555DD62
MVAAVVVAVLLLAWALIAGLGQAQARQAATSGIATHSGLTTSPSGGVPGDSRHHAAPRKKPRQAQLAVQSSPSHQCCGSRTVPPTTDLAGIGLDTPTPTARDSSAVRDVTSVATTLTASADAGRLRLHPSQAPPAA